MKFNDGQIYKLVKKNKKDETKLINNYIINEKELKASDLYMNANEYTENNMTQSQSGTIISMHNIFGITVLNSLWKMLTGKRLFIFYYFYIFLYFIYYYLFQSKFIKESNNFL
uniref:Cytochrome P450 303a1 (CYPCCCIIIA1) n=1 Tax=Apis cerana TaxID=7461 RepID=V9IFJ6_APICE